MLFRSEYFLMMLVRIASFVSIAPFFGMNNTPRRVKIGFSAIVAIIMYQMILPKEPMEYSGVIEFAIIILKEGITGLLIGFAANICNSIVLLSGKIIDMEIGLAMMDMFDTTTNTQSSISGMLYNYFIMILLMVTNMHHYILRALIDSYEVIPINGSIFQWEHLLGTMSMYMTDLMVIGFRKIGRASCRERV